MKIQEMSVHVIAVPLEKPIMPWRFQIPNSPFVFVKLRTDEGHEGLGFCVLITERAAKPLGALLETLKPIVLGQDPTMPEAIWKATYTAAYLAGPVGLAMKAVSAIDVAIWDLFGKIVGQPIYKLLGGARSELPIYGLQRPTIQDPDALPEDALELVGRGFKAIKIFISSILGSGQPREIARRVAATRKALGPNVELALDNEGMWKPHEAVRLGRLLEEYELSWYEDPVFHSDFHGLREVSTALDTAVAAGESLYSVATFASLIEGRCVDIVMVELQRVGGITPFRKVAAIAEGANRLIQPHMMTVIDAHVLAAIPNGNKAEYVPDTDKLFEEPIRVVNGMLQMSDKPGLGCALTPDALERYAL